MPNSPPRHLRPEHPIAFTSDPVMALQLSEEIASGSIGLVKWLSKPPKPLVTQTHDPKMKVAHRGNAMVLKAKVAIEFVDELAESPT